MLGGLDVKHGVFEAYIGLVIGRKWGVFQKHISLLFPAKSQ
jgi:hypothetical protein